jgi:hypothetical protein
VTQVARESSMFKGPFVTDGAHENNRRMLVAFTICCPV